MDIVIPIIGVILSGIVAVLVANIQVKSAIKKLKLEYQQKATEQLFLKRFEVYPKFHSDLLAFTKKRWVEGLIKEDLTKLIEKLDKWEMANAIFVSPLGLSKIRRARIAFGEIEDQLQNNEKISNNKTKKIVGEIYSLMMLLKTELGVLEADDFHNPKNTEKWSELLRLKDKNG